jgi:hypothetical protein
VKSRGIAFADAAHERGAGVDARADRDPGLRAVVAGLLQQDASGRDRLGGVILPGEARNEQRYRGVSDELVDDPVPLVDHLGGRP